IAVTGSLDPADRVEIRAELSGQIERVAVDRGSNVCRDQMLAQFDASIVQARGLSAMVNLGARERDLDAADTLYRAGVLSERDFRKLASRTMRRRLTSRRRGMPSRMQRCVRR